MPKSHNSGPMDLTDYLIEDHNFFNGTSPTSADNYDGGSRGAGASLSYKAPQVEVTSVDQSIIGDVDGESVAHTKPRLYSIASS